VVELGSKQCFSEWLQRGGNLVMLFALLFGAVGG